MHLLPSRRKRIARRVTLALVLALVAGAGVPAATASESAPSSPAGTVQDSGAQLAAADPQAALREAPVSMRIPFPIIRAAGAVEWRGKAFDLAGVHVTRPGGTCGTEAEAWPCGQMALTAMRRFVRARTVDCTPVAGDDEGRLVRCELAGQDIAEWLVGQGWAKADGDTYREAEEAAREASLGLWSPSRPGIAKQAIMHGLSEADLAEAAVRVEVHLSTQQLTLFHNGSVVGRWPVSTARAGKITPTGRWRAQWLSRHHRSSLYNDAPMPYSVFFNGDYAIHGTNDISRLGRPASAGCIRLHPSHAAVVFDLARREGLENTLVVVSR